MSVREYHDPDPLNNTLPNLPILDPNSGTNDRLRQSIANIHEGLHKIQLQQKIDRNRMNLNSETNKSIHNGVVMSSVVETAIFLLASLFQVKRSLTLLLLLTSSSIRCSL
jgi:hypothetical protein